MMTRGHLILTFEEGTGVYGNASERCAGYL